MFYVSFCFYYIYLFIFGASSFSYFLSRVLLYAWARLDKDCIVFPQSWMTGMHNYTQLLVEMRVLKLFTCTGL
jgi:hypothetical protein